MAYEINDSNSKDFTNSWINSSRFLFYLTVFCLLAGLFGNCSNLFSHRYKGTPEVEVQSSSKYKPEYK